MNRAPFRGSVYSSSKVHFLYVQAFLHARHHATFASRSCWGLQSCIFLHYLYDVSNSLTSLTSQRSLASRNQGSGLVALAVQGNKPVTAEVASGLIGHWCRDIFYGYRRISSVDL